MEPAEQNLLLETVQRYKLYFFLILFGLFVSLVLLRIFFHYQQQTSAHRIEFIAASSSAEIKNKVIKIDISGAVINPGVYTIKFDSRIQDALVLAGGLSAEADRDWISQRINLAQKLNDGAKIYIPKKSEQSTDQNPSQSKILGATENTTKDIISINSASKEQLDTLPGVGEVTAQKVIDGRPYQTIEELVSKKIIYKSTFEKIKDKISTN